MTLAPTLSSGVDFERAVEQPSTLGSVANIVGGFASSLADSRKERGPSASDRKRVALEPLVNELADIEGSNMTEAQKARRRRRALRTQLVTTPEFQSDIKGIGVQFGEEPEVEVQNPMDAQAEAMNTFFVTPQGQVADLTARRKATREDGSFDEARYTNLREQAFAENQSILARIEGIEQKRELSSQVWETFKPQAENLVFGVTDDIISLTEQIRLNGSVSIPEELAVQAGIPSGAITQENFVLYLTRYRSSLKQQIRQQALETSGWDSNQLNPATDEYYDSILRPIDDMIAVAQKDFGSISQVKDTLNSQNYLNARRTLEERSPRLAEKMDLLGLIPEQLQLQVFTQLRNEGISEDIARAFTYSYSAAVSTEEVERDIQELSIKDAKANLSTSAQVLGTGAAKEANLRNSFTSFFASRGRVVEGDVYLSEQAWDKIVTKNSKGLSSEFANDPQFAENSSSYLLSDLEMTFNVVKSEGSRFDWASYTVSDSGDLSISVDKNSPSFREEFPEGASDEELQSFKDELLNSPKAKLLRKKVLTLRGMGGTGNQVLSAFGLTSGGAGDDTLGGGEGEDTLSSAGPSLPSVAEDSDFLQSVSNLGSSLNVDPSILFQVMDFETGGSFDPAQLNAAGSGATGLIQFTPDTAKDLGTTVEKLSQMSRVEQMQFVGRYLKRKLAGVDNPTPSDVYMAVLWPKAVGKPEDFVLFKEGSIQYKQNAGLDSNGDGTITKAEASARVFSGSNVSFPEPGGPLLSVRPQERPVDLRSGLGVDRSTQATQGAQTSVQPQSAPVEGESEVRGTEGAETTSTSPEATQAVWSQLEDQTKRLLIRLFGNEEGAIQAIREGEISEEDLK